MTRDRIVGPEGKDEESDFNWGLRPKSLAEYVGQRESVERLKIAIDASKARGESLDHLLLCPLSPGRSRKKRPARDGSIVFRVRRC